MTPRLPTPGSDSGNWGEILNEFLEQAHNQNGTLKDEGVLTSKYVKPTGGIPKTDLDGPVQATLDKADVSLSNTEVNSTIVASLADPTSDVSRAIETVAGNVRLVGFDDFTDASNGALAGRMPVVGPAWITSGSSLPRIEDGSLLNPGSGYAVLQLTEKANYIEAISVFGGTAATATNTLAWADDNPFALSNLFHLIYGAQGFTLTIRQDGEAVFPILLGGEWDVPCVIDDVTPYRVGVLIRGDSFTIIGPHGEVYSGSDPRVSTVCDTSAVFWQPVSHGGAAWQRILAIRALHYSDTERALSSNISLLDFARIGARSDGYGNTVGQREEFTEVTVGRGRGGNAGYPTVTFGPETIRTYLVTSVPIGATTITVDRALRTGAVKINGGNGAEDGSITGNPAPLPGAGYPYVMTLATPTTKAHPAGTVIVQSGLAQASILYNPLAGVRLTVSDTVTFSGDIYRNNVKVVTSRRTGWTAATGTATRTTFDTSTVTTAELAQHMKALIDDLITHGLIGS